MGESVDKSRQASADPDVTQAMLDVGVDVLHSMDRETDGAYAMVRAIFVQMDRARRAEAGSGSPPAQS